MDIINKEPEDVLKPEFVKTYKELHKDIWYRLIRVNTSLTILEKIHNFPFHPIYSPQDNIFWAMVSWNFFDISILFMNQLTSDGSDEHTINGFRNRILNEDWLKNGVKEEYRKLLRNIKLDKRLEPIQEKIKEIRKNVIAHRLLDSNRASVTNVKNVTLDELHQLSEGIKKLFRSISFVVEYDSNFYTGGTIGGKPVKEDIDELLDLILKHSYWLNEPEQMKDFWPDRRRSRSQEEISELNEFRKKFGMPEV